jgi:tetratricopeptide (TPR) repeat protein
MKDQLRYADAESTYKRALVIAENKLGRDHTNIAELLNELAEVYRAEGHFVEAELLYERALAIEERVRGPEPERCSSLTGRSIRLQQ